MREGCGRKGLPNTQTTNIGRNIHHYFPWTSDQAF